MYTYSGSDVLGLGASLMPVNKSGWCGEGVRKFDERESDSGSIFLFFGLERVDKPVIPTDRKAVIKFFF